MKKRALVLCTAAAVMMTACSSGQETASTTTAAESTTETTVAESTTVETTTVAETTEEESKEEQAASGIFEGNGSGFGGELKLEVTVTDGKMEKIDVVSHHESSVVYNRAIPIITERILDAQTPEVDSVSGATFTS